MHMENLYRQIRKMIAGNQYEALSSLNIAKPAKFNWVTEVFENINVKDHPQMHKHLYGRTVSKQKNFPLKN